MIRYIHEIFADFKDTTTKEQRKRILWNNNSLVLQTVLRGAFHPDIHFYVPPDFTYIPNQIPHGDITMMYAIKRAYLFEKGNKKAPVSLSPEKRRKLLVGILEHLPAKEAEVYLGMLKKELNVPYLTHRLVHECYPNLIPPPTTSGA